MDFVNFVNYKIYMTKNNNNNENKAQIISLEDHKQYKERGIYMRDDHCDWGSSGMKEIASENTESN
jgi:hypothetical protein